MFRPSRWALAVRQPPIWSVGPLAGSAAAASPLCTPRRCQADRPSTFSEITEAVTVLGIDGLPNLSEKELKGKYRALVKQHHPDAGGTEAMMSRITVAYDRITRMSKREKEEFDMQRKAFRGGGSGSSAFAQYARSPQSNQRGRNPYEASYKYNPDEMGGRATDGPRGGPGWAQEGQFSRAYHNRQHGPGSRRSGPTYGQASRGQTNPNATPFSILNMFSPWEWNQRANKGMRDIRSFTMPQIFVRLCVSYILASMLFAVFWRRYRDWQQEEGWSMAERLSKDEQREELTRVRREMAERMRSARDPMGAAAREREKEQRALEYAERRTIELNLQNNQKRQELRGWPAVPPSKGKIVRRPFEPIGVVYYEPTPPATADAMTSLGQSNPQSGGEFAPSSSGGISGNGGSRAGAANPYSGGGSSYPNSGFGGPSSQPAVTPSVVPANPASMSAAGGACPAGGYAPNSGGTLAYAAPLGQQQHPPQHQASLSPQRAAWNRD